LAVPDKRAVVIRPAMPDDAAPLTALMKASAAYSGAYAAILENYAVTPGQIVCDVVSVALSDGALVGFYSLTLDGEPELDLMFVADNVQGRGIGAILFAHMREQAGQRGVEAIRIVSHPPSVDFYRRMGATLVGTKSPTPTASWERPILTLAV
jgi:GNAT superfamily N-acetyltransferase